MKRKIKKIEDTSNQRKKITLL